MVDGFADVVGQVSAVARLTEAAERPLHAYLLRGPRGSGRMAAALGFAALLLSDGLEPEAADRATRLSLRRSHPDLHLFEPQGPAYRVEEASAIAAVASTSPVEGDRKVIIISSVELLVMATIGKLLKVIEEPPPTVVFVLLGEEMGPELVTIVSRCVVIDFAGVSEREMIDVLIGAGVEPGRAASAALAAGGDMGRARLLANDDALANRAELWASIPDRIDGTGATVAELVAQVRDAISSSFEPLADQQTSELEDLAERAERLGERGSGRADLVARHKRETRRYRSDELMFGFSVLSRHYRDQLLVADSDYSLAALSHLARATDGLRRNPNEALLLQSLLLRIGPTR